MVRQRPTILHRDLPLVIAVVVKMQGGKENESVRERKN